MEPYIKSEPIPEHNDEPVKVVVSHTFQDIVFKSRKNGMYKHIHWNTCEFKRLFTAVFDFDLGIYMAQNWKLILSLLVSDLALQLN